jgi:hypothetical protein
MTALAYALVIIPISTFVVTLCTAIAVPATGLPLFWIPNPQGSWIRGFLAGLAAEMGGFGYGYLIFHFLVGADSFTLLPACVAAIPLVFPPINDLRHAKKVAATGESIRDYKEVQNTVGVLWGSAIGEAIGIPVGIVVFGVVL